MPLKFPDILQNNNFNYPLVDITEIRGTTYPIGQLSETGSIPTNKRKIGSIYFVSSSQQFYGYYGQSTTSGDWDNPLNWKNLSSGSAGSSQSVDGAITTGSLNTLQTILGGLQVNGGVTASLQGTSSWAQSASNTPNALVTASVNINDITFTKGNGSQFTVTINTGSTVVTAGGSSGQIQYNNSSTLDGVSSLTYDGTNLIGTGSFSGSFQGYLTGTAQTASYITSSNIWGPYGQDSVISASYADTASVALQALSLVGIQNSYPIILTGSTLYSYDSSRDFQFDLTNSVSPGSNFIMGYEAGFTFDTQNFDFTTLIGYRAGRQATNLVDTIAIGAQAAENSISSSNSVFLGFLAGAYTDLSDNSLMVGTRSGFTTQASNAVFIGRFSGWSATNADNSIFIGRNTGRSARNSDHSILLGYNVGANAFPSTDLTNGIGRNNIIIGTNITLEEGRQDSINIGSIIFGTGSYYGPDVNTLVRPYSGTVDGRIGINVRDPQYTFDVSGSGNFSNTLTITGSIYSTGSNYFIGNQSIIGDTTQTGSVYSTGSNIHNGIQTITGSLYTTGSNIFIGEQTVTGSLYTTGSNTLIGTTTLTGSLNITGSTTQIGTNTLQGNTTLSGSIIISGSNSPGALTASIQIYGDIKQSGYHRFDPVSTNIDQSISASYIYVSGSTQDLYFTQNGAGYNNTTRLRWLEGNLYTGLLYGGVISASPGSTTFNVSSGSGIIVTLNASTGSEPYPTIKYVTWGNITGTTPAFLTSKIQTFIGIDAAGAIMQRTEPWGDGLYNTSLSLGTVLHQNKSTINATITYPNTGYGYKQRTYDFIKAFGPLKLAGYEIQQSGSLGLTIGAGKAFSDGRNYQVDPNNPAYIDDPGTTVSKIFRYYASGSEFVQDTNNGLGYTVLDPTQYVDSSGSLQTLANNNRYSNQRVFWYPNSATKGIVVYYGTQEYDSIDAAVLNIPYERFSEVENTKQNAVFLGILTLAKNADWASSTSYRILQSGIFRSVGGAAGTTINVTALDNLSDVALSTPTFGDLLMYGNASEWNNTKNLKGNYTISGSLSITGSLNATSSYPIAAIASTIYSTISGIPTSIPSDCIILGDNAASGATNASNSNFLGTDAGKGSLNSIYSNFLGSRTGFNATNADHSNFLGLSAGEAAVSASNSNFLGKNAGIVAAFASSSNFIGVEAGYYASYAEKSNFIGAYAGSGSYDAAYSNLIGYKAGTRDVGSIGSNNIVIGTNITLPNGASNAVNIGGILFATGSYGVTTGNAYSGSVGGKVGIGISTPAATLHIQGDIFQKATASYTFGGNSVDVNNQYNWYGYNSAAAYELNLTDFGVSIVSSTTSSIYVAGDVTIGGAYPLPHTWTNIYLSDTITYNPVPINSPYYSDIASITFYSQSYDPISGYATISYSSSLVPGKVLPNTIYETVTEEYGSLISSASIYFPKLTTSQSANLVTIDIATGKLYYTASSAVGGTGGAGTISGSGATNYLTVWSGSSALSSSVIYQTGGNLGIGTTTPSAKLDISGSTIIRQKSTTALTLVGSGSAIPVFAVYGSQGELFSITDSLSGSLFSVHDRDGNTVIESFSDSTTLIGNYQSPALYTTVKKTINTGSAQIIYQLPTASYDGLFVDYTIRSGSNARVGNIISMWSGSATTKLETTASQFGDTSGFTFGTQITGSNFILSGSATSNGWTIKTIIKAI